MKMGTIRVQKCYSAKVGRRKSIRNVLNLLIAISLHDENFLVFEIQFKSA